MVPHLTTLNLSTFLFLLVKITSDRLLGHALQDTGAVGK